MTANMQFQNRQVSYIALGLTLALYLALAIGNAFAAAPWCDEAWFANPAYNLATKGFMGTTVLTPFGWKAGMHLERIAQHTYWVMPLHLVAQAGWYKIFGFSLFTMRLLSVLCGVVAIVSLGWLVERLSGSRGVMLLAMLLVSVDYFFLTRAADGRMDMMSAAFNFASLATYVRFRESSLNRAVLAASALAAASGFTHPTGGFLSVVGVLTLAFYFDRQRLRPRHALLAAAPYLIGSLAWGVYILKDPAAFFAQMTSNAAGRFAGLRTIERWVTRTLPGAFGVNDKTAVSIQYLRLAPLTAYLAGVAGAVASPLSRRPGYRALLLVTVIDAVALMLFDGFSQFFYLIHIVPLLAVTLAAWIAWVWQNRRFPRVATALALAGLVFLQVSGAVYRIRQNDYHNRYQPLVDFIKQNGGERVSIIGSAELGFGLGFPDSLKDDVSLGYYSGAKPALIFIPKLNYGVWMQDLQISLPGAIQHIKSMLAKDYRIIYDRDGYSVFRRIQ
jgi:4-amino-4-deoxy-L-arabinose transferase-like glycosyltransferase